jgi:hypothetical protein
MRSGQWTIHAPCPSSSSWRLFWSYYGDYRCQFVDEQAICHGDARYREKVALIGDIVIVTPKSMLSYVIPRILCEHTYVHM